MWVGVEEVGDAIGDDVVVASVSRNSEAGAGGGPMPSHTVNTHTHTHTAHNSNNILIDPVSVSSSHLEEVLPLPDLDIFTGRYVSEY